MFTNNGNNNDDNNMTVSQTWKFERSHTRGDKMGVTFSLAGHKGRAWLNNVDGALKAGETIPETVTAILGGSGNNVVTYKATTYPLCDNGAPRYIYACPGGGTFTIAGSWLGGEKAGNEPPKTIELVGLALAAGRPRVTAGATSAVIAAANIAQAKAKAEPVAVPSVVAATVAQIAETVVEAASKGNKKGNKAHTAKVG